jgi:hypothetical protein
VAPLGAGECDHDFQTVINEVVPAPGVNVCVKCGKIADKRGGGGGEVEAVIRVVEAALEFARWAGSGHFTVDGVTHTQEAARKLPSNWREILLSLGAAREPVVDKDAILRYLVATQYTPDGAMLDECQFATILEAVEEACTHPEDAPDDPYEYAPGFVERKHIVPATLAGAEEGKVG